MKAPKQTPATKRRDVQKFAALITAYCEQRGFSQRQLAREAGVSVGRLWEWRVGRRSCGPVSALRLSQALQLEEPQRSEFLDLAQHTTIRHSPTLAIPQFEAQVLDRLRKALKNLGVNTADLRAVDRPATSKAQRADYVALLPDGRKLVVEFKDRRVIRPKSFKARVMEKAIILEVGLNVTGSGLHSRKDSYV